MIRKLLAALLLACGLAMPIIAVKAIAAEEAAAEEQTEESGKEQTDSATAGDSGSGKDESDASEGNSLAPAPPRAIPYPHSSRQQDVLHHLKLNNRHEEIVSLLRGEDGFYGLFLRERSGRPQGGALLLHDLEQHGQWPELTGPLREQLPEYGWATLATELPVYAINRIPPRSIPEPITQDGDESVDEDGADSETEQTNPAEEAEPAETDTQDNIIEPPLTPETSETATNEGLNESTGQDPAALYADITRGRIEESLTYLNNRGQLNLVIIAHGDSAVWAALTIQQRQRDNDNARGIALVMVDAREHPASALRLTQILETLDIPILDLITAANHSNNYTLNQRRGSMNRQHRDTYRQIHLAGSDPQSPEAIRRIRGWLRSNAAGTELP
ncbi:MAG: DUF3530 family protein [Thalassolituus sp.]